MLIERSLPRISEHFPFRGDIRCQFSRNQRGALWRKNLRRETTPPIRARPLLGIGPRGGAVPSESAIRAEVEALLDQHEGDLIRYGLSLCGDRDLAEDAVQESFIALVAELRRGVVIDEPSAWLTRVVRNRTRDSQRKEIRVHRREAAVAALDRGGATPDFLEIDEQRGAVSRLLAELDPAIREVVELSVIAGKSYREVASITGASLGTVANRVHQGLRSIAEGLRAAGVIEGGAR